MKILRKNYKQLLIWLLPLIVLGASIFLMGLNLGVDFASANVMQFETDSLLPSEEIHEVVSDLGSISRIEQFSSGRVNVYFQNVNLEEINNYKSILDERLEGISGFQSYEYQPTTLIFINTRILYAVLVGFFLFTGFTIYLLKSKGVKRYEVVVLIVSDFLLVVSMLIFMTGAINLLGLFGSQINSANISVALAFVFYLLTMNIVITGLTKDENESLAYRWKDSSILFVERALKYTILMSLPLLGLVFVSKDLRLMILVYLVGFVYALYLFTQCKLVSLAGGLGLASKIKIHKNRFLSKDW